MYEKEAEKKRMILLVLLLLLISLIAAYVFFYRTPQTLVNSDKADSSFIKKMTDDELLKYMQKEADKNYVRLTLNTQMEWQAGQKVGKVHIQNPPANEHAMRVKTYLVKTGELIYHSGIIRPKHYVLEGQLKKTLTSGNYKTRSRIEFLDSNQKVVGKSTIAGQLLVKP